MAEEVCGLPLQADEQKGQRESYTREEKLTGVSFHKECSLEPTENTVSISPFQSSAIECNFVCVGIKAVEVRNHGPEGSDL